LIKLLEEVREMGATYVHSSKTFYDRLKAVKDRVSGMVEESPELAHLQIVVTDEGLLKISKYELSVNKDGSVSQPSIALGYEDILRIAALLQKDMD
jgi:hypothetical protein